MKDITIQIIGPSNSGKSRLTYLLEQFLKKEGYNVEAEVELDYPNKDVYTRIMKHRLEEVKQKIKEDTKITLRQIRIK